MNRSPRTFALPLLALYLCLLPATPGAAQTEAEEDNIRHLHGEQVRIFGDVRIPESTVLHGDLIVVFGDAVIDGTVQGDVVVVLGTLTVNGHVDRSTTAVLTDISLGENSEIEGDFINVLGNIDDLGADFLRTYSNIPLPGVSFLALLRWFRGVALFLFFVTMLFLASMVPDRIRVISREAPHRYFSAIFAGFLGLLLWLLILPLLTATVVGLFLGWPLYLMLSWLGRMAILHWIGERIGVSLGLRLSLLGSMFLAFIPYALLKVGPMFVGGYFGLLVAGMFSTLMFLFLDVPGLGLILLTRAGSRPKNPPVTVDTSIVTEEINEEGTPT